MTGIVGAGVPIALGAAKAALIKGSKSVTVSTCGDGAMQQAALIPLLIWPKSGMLRLYIINNNLWGWELTPLDRCQHDGRQGHC